MADKTQNAIPSHCKTPFLPFRMSPVVMPRYSGFDQTKAAIMELDKRRVVYAVAPACFDSDGNIIPCRRSSLSTAIIITIVVIGILLLLISVYFSWRYFRRRRELKEQEQERKNGLRPLTIVGENFDYKYRSLPSRKEGMAAEKSESGWNTHTIEEIRCE